MVIGKIKYSFPEFNFLFRLNESMEVVRSVHMLLLGYDILSDSVLLSEVLKGRLRRDRTLRISQKPAFGSNSTWSLWFHFASNIKRKIGPPFKAIT